MGKGLPLGYTAPMDRNLRRGYLAEKLGAYLLRPLAAIAEVPRPDDVGVDAVCTLLRPHDARRLIPDVSFCVQFKAASMKQIRYPSREFAWIQSLPMPLFFGRVDVDKASMDLFSSHALSRAMVGAGDLGRFCMFEFAFEDAQTMGEYAVKGGKKLRMRTGPPVLSWRAEDVGRQEFLSSAYKVLKTTIDCEWRNIILRPTGAVTWMQWSTNSEPQLLGPARRGSNRGGADLSKALDVALPFYECVLSNCVHKDATIDDIQLHEAMIRYFEQHGVHSHVFRDFGHTAKERLSWCQTGGSGGRATKKP